MRYIPKVSAFEIALLVLVALEVILFSFFNNENSVQSIMMKCVLVAIAAVTVFIVYLLEKMIKELGKGNMYQDAVQSMFTLLNGDTNETREYVVFSSVSKFFMRNSGLSSTFLEKVPGQVMLRFKNYCNEELKSILKWVSVGDRSQESLVEDLKGITLLIMELNSQIQKRDLSNHECEDDSLLRLTDRLVSGS